MGYEIKKLIYSKGNNRMKRQPIEWEQICASYSSNKELIFRIHKEHKSVAKGQIWFKNRKMIWIDISER
jgi:hypothetical protein